MKALMALVLCLGLAGAACGDSANSTPTPTIEPARGELDAGLAVGEWLAALGDGNQEAITRVVPDRHVLVMVSLENSIRYEQVAALDRSGIDEDTVADYWASFASEFERFTESSPSELEIIGFTEFDIDGVAFAAVEVGLASSFGTTEIMAIEAGGRWYVDLLGTFGPDLVRPMRTLFASLGADADADLVAEILAEAVPSMRAALLRQSADDLPVEYVVETEALIGLLAAPRP